MKKEFKYHRGPTAPAWFDKADPNHYDITSGYHYLNEWYAFEDDAHAHDVACEFTSQLFIDEFIWIETEARWYHFEDLDEHLNEDECSHSYTPKKDTSPADVRALLETESLF